MEKFSRSVRRHHRERLMVNRKVYHGGNITSRLMALYVDTPTPCSCHMCGNPRKWFKEQTVQERRFKEGQDIFDCVWSFRLGTID